MNPSVNMTDVFNIRNIIIYFIAINIIAFLAMWIDKEKAKMRFLEN